MSKETIVAKRRAIRAKDLPIEVQTRLGALYGDQLVVVRRPPRYRARTLPTVAPRFGSRRQELGISDLVRELHQELKLLNDEISSYSW